MARGRAVAMGRARARSARRDPSTESSSSSPSPDPPTPPRAKKRTRQGRGVHSQKKARSTGCKGKGKGKGRSEAAWGTTDPNTQYPDFSHNWGPTQPLDYNAVPTQYFQQVYPPELVDLIVDQTNLYAQQRGVTGWVDTTAREIEAFLGIVMATSIHRVPRLNNIWSSDWVLGSSLHQEALLAAVVQSPPCRQHSGTRSH